MLSEARQKKIRKNLDRSQNAQFWGLKTLGSRGGGERALRDPRGSASDS